MNNYSILEIFQKLQYEMTGSKDSDSGLVDLGYSKIFFADEDKTMFWNYALIDAPLSDAQILETENRLQSLNRDPAIYFENRADFKDFIQNLTNKGYNKSHEDSWMFHDGENLDKSRFDEVKKVETEDDLKVFLQVSDMCYQKDDPQNPYGEQGDYLKIAEKAWHKCHASNDIDYFMAYKVGTPVAVAALSNIGGIGYVFNVGSLRTVRSEGFGKLATLYCVEISKQRGHKLHCLATEEGTYPNEFYKNIGFETKFTAVGYVKN